MSHLNQYYTESTHCDTLVRSLTIPSPRIALDLGFGKGNLLNAAKRRWDKLNLVGIDIDQRNVINAKSKNSIEALILNGFDPSLPSIINDRFGEIDLLVSNPPYFSCDLDLHNKQILDAVGILDCLSQKMRKVPAELIFLAQNLRLLSKTGELGIIVPAGLISGQRWQSVREFLFSNYHISNVIQLPTNSFKKTDAQTFILTIKNKTNDIIKIPLSHTINLELLNVDPNEAIKRADYNYHKELSNLKNDHKLSTDDFKLYRGNKSHKELHNSGKEYLHTTNMPKTGVKKTLPEKCINAAKNTCSGDILVARVGRRCLGRTLYVERGNIPISDCIIGIRPRTKKIGKEIWKKLSTNEFRQYMAKTSLGVGAKYITYRIISDYLIGNDYPNSK